MNKRGLLNCILLLSVTLMALFFPANQVQAAAQSTQVLLLYDSLAKDTAREGNVSELQRLLAAYSTTVTLRSVDQYEQGLLEKYSRVIMVSNVSDLPITNTSYLEDQKHYEGQYMHIGYNLPSSIQQKLQLAIDVMYEGSANLQIGQFSGISFQVKDMPYIAANGAADSIGKLSFDDNGLQAPYAVSKGNDTYVPYFDQENASRLAMGHVLKEWLQITATSKIYFAIKEIYPFTDLSLLAKTADRLYDIGVPFMASVRPVFSNTDYPAMQRYLVAMKSVQAKNGTILVNAPVAVHSTSTNNIDHSLKGKMNDFINLLVDNGIGPLGIGAQMHWTYDKEYSEAGMGFFDSAVLYPDEQIDYTEQRDISKSFTSSLYSIPMDFLRDLHTDRKVISELPMNTVVTVDMPKNEQELEDMLQSLEQYFVSFADYKQDLHQVVTDTYTVTSAEGVISINGQALSLDYVPEVVDSSYQYTEEHAKSFTRLFHIQNQFFIVVIIISLLLFGGLMMIGYRLYRKKFLK